MKLKRLLLTLTFLCISGVSVCAQSEPNWAIRASPTPPPTAQDTRDVDELKTEQQLIAELKFLRRENAALKAEVVAKKGELQVTTHILKRETERGDFFKEAAQKGIQVGSNAVALEVKYQEQVNLFKDENIRLRVENGKLRSSRNWMSLLSGIGGAGVGYAVCSR